MSRFHKDNLRHLPRFPDFLLTFWILLFINEFHTRRIHEEAFWNPSLGLGHHIVIHQLVKGPKERLLITDPRQVHTNVEISSETWRYGWRICWHDISWSFLFFIKATDSLSFLPAAFLILPLNRWMNINKMDGFLILLAFHVSSCLFSAFMIWKAKEITNHPSYTTHEILGSTGD